MCTWCRPGYPSSGPGSLTDDARHVRVVNFQPTECIDVDGDVWSWVGHFLVLHDERRREESKDDKIGITV